MDTVVNSRNTPPRPGGLRGIESRSIDYVPLRERHGKAWHLWPVWFTGDAHLATVATGVLGISMGSNLLWTGIAIIAGCAFGTFFMAFHSSQGPQLGLPQMIQSRPQFGYLGALLVWVVALVTYLGYNAFNQLLAGEAAHLLFGVDPTVAYLVFTVLAVLLAVFGYDWIHKAQRWLAYGLLLVLGVFSVGIGFTGRIPSGQFSASGFHAEAFAIQFFVAAAYQLSWAIYVSDYSRYLPRTVGVRATFWWTYLGALIGGAWMMLVGAVAASVNAGLNTSEAIHQAGNAIFPGFGTVLVVLALLGLITITGLNFYGASLTLLSIADSVRPVRSSRAKRIVTLLICAVLSTSVALSASANFLHEFEHFLGILLLLFTPWTAINLVDFFWVRHTHYSIREIFNPRGMYGRWGWRGLLAYAAGFVAMLPFVNSALYTGPVARLLGGTDIAMLPGLVVSGAVYLLACRSLDIAAERALIARADADLETTEVR
ncbi:cytosine permease [Amycolatopsis deserti]|uniref:Cytosine permease n=1 Tax=Amycolatopsis deserti TaxID=185696 RepID=A0ABQ3IDL0_9PSEU|nr:cytosine permease [Amycolatopsis deserti]GHE79473.1 cytosine permease [Amycolatopsis deserti]